MPASNRAWSVAILSSVHVEPRAKTQSRDSDPQPRYSLRTAKADRARRPSHLPRRSRSRPGRSFPQGQPAAWCPALNIHRIQRRFSREKKPIRIQKKRTESILLASGVRPPPLLLRRTKRTIEKRERPKGSAWRAVCTPFVCARVVKWRPGSCDVGAVSTLRTHLRLTPLSFFFSLSFLFSVFPQKRADPHYVQLCCANAGACFAIRRCP